MTHRNRKLWNLHESKHTAESVFFQRRWQRREWLQSALATAGAIAGVGGLPLLSGCSEPLAEEVIPPAELDPLFQAYGSAYPAKRNGSFAYGRDETVRLAAASFTNFYEFSAGKSVYQYVTPFQTTPWTVEVTGLCAKPQTFDLDQLYQKFALEERAYRHRCVETWAMCVPWTGFPLKELLSRVEPSPSAKYVAFKTFHRPGEAAHMQDESFPWPYTEGLTIAEATNELTLLALGVYGAPLLKQHGAPVRLVVPWKYGFKSIKSITEIHLTDQRPATFWNTLNPDEYKFESNVDPEVRHPRWSQKYETMLGTQERLPTQKYNGYAELVSHLYDA